MEYIKDILLRAGTMNPVKGVVIHNDAGSMNGKQYVEWLKNRNLELGIAHWYIDRNYSAQVIENTDIGWHTASQEGNGHYIGYEVCESKSASDEDFLKNEEAVFRQAAKDMKSFGITPNRDTVRLHKEFSSTTCPHRSWDLHGQELNAVKDYFIIRIKHYMDNPDSSDSGSFQTSGSSSQTTNKPPNSDSPSTTSGAVSTTLGGSGHIWRYNDFAISIGERKQRQGRQNSSVNSQIQSSGNSNPNGNSSSSNSNVEVNTGQLKGKASDAVRQALDTSNWNSFTDGGLPGIDVDGHYGAQCFDLANFYLMKIYPDWDILAVDAWFNGNFVRQYRTQLERRGWKLIEHPKFSDLSIGAITFEQGGGSSWDSTVEIHTEMITAIEGNLVSYLTQNYPSPNITTVDTGGRAVGVAYQITMIAIPPSDIVK